MITKRANYSLVALGLVAGAILVGCGSPPVETTTGSAPQAMAPAGQKASAADIAAVYGSLPGIPGNAKPLADAPKAFATEGKLVAARYGPARKDPFALKPEEKNYETAQETMRVMGEMGGWVTLFTPKEEKNPDANLIIEPQPYRRLSGIIIGESVYAILDQGDGQPLIIRPGMKIPNSNWTVASIDEEKAILTRTGNTLPRTVVVRLESPPAGQGPSNTRTASPGGPGGPGGPPAGFTPPGGPGGRAGPGGRGGPGAGMPPGGPGRG
ncbi:hypothetical protein BH11ARM1_BH11ARM1_18120 [soil metagenome]